jgi:hypothetical protein
MANATAIGFSSGQVPTNDGVQYPYIYHSVAGGTIALLHKDGLTTLLLLIPH